MGIEKCRGELHRFISQKAVGRDIRISGRARELVWRRCMDFHLVPPSELSRIVFYNPQDPDTNKIAMAFLFHRLVVLGRGVTDLNVQTVEAQEALAEIRPRPLAPEEI